jgi:hypothetical protein
MTSNDSQPPRPHDPELTAVLNRFEEAWEGQVPPAIQGFLPQPGVQQPGAHRETLLLELISIDLEHRWRRAKTSGEDVSPLNSIGTSTANPLPARPRLEDYLHHFSQFKSLRELPANLIADEFRVRQQWGDQPALSEYRARLGGRDEVVEQALQEALSEIAAITLIVYRNQQLAFKMRLPGPLELGRQRHGEPPPFGQVHTDAGSRLIIASREQNAISRHSVHIERQNVTVISVTNRTSKRTVHVNSSAVQAGATCEANLPVLIVLADAAIRLET